MIVFFSLAECMAGFQLSSTGNCEACPLGYYRTRGQPSCEPCPAGYTTGSIAAINIGQCNLGKFFFTINQVLKN